LAPGLLRRRIHCEGSSTTRHQALSTATTLGPICEVADALLGSGGADCIGGG
jgi:hypothetical protein